MRNLHFLQAVILAKNLLGAESSVGEFRLGYLKPRSFDQ